MHTVFHVKKSRFYYLYLTITHCFALGCFELLGQAVLSTPFLLISFLYFLSEKTNILSLQHKKKREWILQFASEDTSALLLGSSVMLSHLFILHFQLPDNRKYAVVLFSDCFSMAELKLFRRCVRKGFL